MPVPIVSGFVDLGTYDEQETFHYGGDCINLFRRTIVKSSWFSLVATTLTNSNGSSNFRGTHEAYTSRTADHVLNVWYRTRLPALPRAMKTGTLRPAGATSITNPAQTTDVAYQPRWTRNIGHNLVEEFQLSYNELKIVSNESAYMDFISAFCVSASKYQGYQNMIGNVVSLVDPYSVVRYPSEVIDANNPAVIPAYTVNVPVHMWFSSDVANSIISCATPFNDIKFSAKLRAVEDLIVVDLLRINGATGMSVGDDPDSQGTTAVAIVGTLPTQSSVAPAEYLAAIGGASTLSLSEGAFWAHYVVIPNQDREKIGDEEEIDQAIIQTQHLSPKPWNMANTSTFNMPIRLSQSVRSIYFAVRNTTIPTERSNYSTHHPEPWNNSISPSIIFSPPNTSDPIARAVCQYDNSNRWEADADYFSLVAPYYFAPAIPTLPGYHLLTYAIDIKQAGSWGSTNLGRIANITMDFTASPVAIANAVGATSGNYTFPARQRAYKGELVAILDCAQTIRSSGGACGFPLL